METEKADPRVAVVMITRNRVHEVLRSLAHLFRLSERPRIVLVDNASEDGTREAVAERFPEVQFVEAGGNLGAAARTVGARHVAAPYIAFCDDDTWWDPGCLRTAADLFDAQPRLAVITARILVGSENREDPICRVLAHSPLPREPGMPGPSLLGFMAGASVVRQSAFLEAGGFEPRFVIGGEEELLAVDLASRNWWLCYVDELIVHHHPSPARNPTRRRNSLARNAFWFAWLRRPLPIALRRTLKLAQSGPWDRATLELLAEAFGGLPWALRQRRVVPPEIERGLRLLEAHA